MARGRCAAQGALDTLGPRIERSTLGLAATIGRFDPTRPVYGLNLRPSIEVTTPPSLNTVEFAHIEFPVSGYRPLTSRIGIAASLRVGRLLPFGNTFAGDTIGAVEAVRLRDVLLTLGGTGSVRGWGSGLLGPKVLNLRLQKVEGSDSVTAVGCWRVFAPGWTLSYRTDQAPGAPDIRLLSGGRHP